MAVLGVNVDHVATVRQARRGKEPSPVEAAQAAIRGGAKWITVHLREDRRHIQDEDVRMLKEELTVLFNLEMANTAEMLKIALAVHPDQITFVPEKRTELTTEGGLNAVKELSKLKKSARQIKAEGIPVSFFIDPDEEQIKAAHDAEADFVELHTGFFANAQTRHEEDHALVRLVASGQTAADLGLRVNAGHGLNYLNVSRVLQIPKLEQLHIGHSIVSRALFDGMEKAVREMVRLIG